MSNKISIIVPVYNTESYLKKCFDSIIAQTYTNLEIILVDDGSTDNSGKICDEYANKDARVKVIHKENGGMSDARNKGLDIATGDIITFVDSDDYIDKEMYEKMEALLVEHDADIVCCAYKLVNNKEVRDYSDGKVVLFDEGEMFAEYISPTQGCMPSPAVWNRLYKRAIFDDIRFIEGRMYEDKDISCRTLAKCKKGVFINTAFYNYVYREGSVSRLPMNAKSADDFVYMYKIQLDMIQQKLNKNVYMNAIQVYYLLLLDSYCRVYKRDKMARTILSNEMNRVKQDAKIALANKKGQIPAKDYKMITKSFISPTIYYYMLKIGNKLSR